MTRFVRALLLALAGIVLVATPVLAYLYRAPIAITENASVSYTMLPILWNQNNVWLASNGFMNSTANDTRVQTLGGLNKPWMIADNKTLTAIPVPADSQTNLYFATGDTAASAMDIILGYGGYVTTTDNPALEIGSNGLVAISDIYLPSGISANLTRKNASFSVSWDGSGNVTATVSTVIGYTNVGPQAYVNGAYSDITFPQQIIIGARLRFYNSSGTTAYDVYPRVFQVWDVDTSAWVNFDSVSSDWTTDANMLDGDTGTFATKEIAASGWSSNATFILNSAVTSTKFRYYSTREDAVIDQVDSDTGQLLSLSASGVPAGEHDNITLSANTAGGQTELWIDGSLEDSDALVTFPGNGNSIVWMEGIPYASGLSVSVNGTQQLYYAPNAIISGTTLPDREDAIANDGVITWGSNPAGVGVTLGSMTSSGQPSVGGTAGTSTGDILPPVGGTDWRPDAGVSATLQTNPMRPIVTAISDNTSLSEYQVWVWFGITFVAFITVLVGSRVRGHHLITGIAASAAIVLMVVWTVFPLLSLIVIVLAIWGGLVSERSPSL